MSNTQRWTAAALAAALTLLLYAPALPDLLAQRGMYTAARGNEPGVFGPEGWHTLLQLGGSWSAWAALPGLALAAFGLASAPRRCSAAVSSPVFPVPMRRVPRRSVA